MVGRYLRLLPSRFGYYASSIPTLFGGFQNWWQLSRCLLPARMRSPFEIKLRKHDLRFRVRSAMDAWVLKETCLDDDYGLAALSGQGRFAIIDIGAGIGDFAILSAKRFPGATVYAFEPIPSSYSLLTANVAANKVQNIRTLPLAIFAKSGSRILQTAGREAVQYGYWGKDTEPSNGIRVEGKALGEVFEEFHIEECGFLKIDCEGGEYEILLSAADSVLRSIQRISLEYHEGEFACTGKELAKYLRAKGFRVQVRPNRAHGNLGFLLARREP